MMHWYGGGYEYGWIWMLLSATFWIVLIGLLAWGVTALVGTRRQRDETALDILERRYASGEIDDQEFERRRQALRQLGYRQGQ